MKITQDVRDYAEEHGMTSVEAIEAGMDEKSGEFNDHGGRVYLPITDHHTPGSPTLSPRTTCPIDDH
jgi:phosphomethylpyrimidine synthase